MYKVVAAAAGACLLALGNYVSKGGERLHTIFQTQASKHQAAEAKIKLLLSCFCSVTPCFLPRGSNATRLLLLLNCPHTNCPPGSSPPIERRKIIRKKKLVFVKPSEQPPGKRFQQHVEQVSTVSPGWRWRRTWNLRAKRKPKQRNYPRGNTRIGNRRRRRPEEKRHGKANRRTFFFLFLFSSSLYATSTTTQTVFRMFRKSPQKKQNKKKHGPRNRL